MESSQNLLDTYSIVVIIYFQLLQANSLKRLLTVRTRPGYPKNMTRLPVESRAVLAAGGAARPHVICST